jgi:hypothetical protein
MMLPSRPVRAVPCRAVPCRARPAADVLSVPQCGRRMEGGTLERIMAESTTN